VLRTKPPLVLHASYFSLIRPCPSRDVPYSHSSSVWSVTFSPDGKQLASGSIDNTIKLWDPTTGELRQTLEGHCGSVLSVTFSPDGKQLASGSSDNTTKLWDSTTGELWQTLEGHSNWVWSKGGTVISILHGQWLCHRNKRIIWLPQAYRPNCLAVSKGVIALGDVSGSVSLISRNEILD
jgi:WD40 repeat protein